MAFVRPRLNDFYDLPFTQEQVSFAIPLLDSDIPLYVDPFLLWKSPSQQDQALHTAMIAALNHIGRLYANGGETKAIELLIGLSECPEVGLGMASNRQGKRIGKDLAHSILGLFKDVPQIERDGLQHLEAIQLLVDQIGKDRISDLACSLLKSFLIDFTIDQCRQWAIPMVSIPIHDVFDSRVGYMKTELSIRLNCAGLFTIWSAWCRRLVAVRAAPEYGLAGLLAVLRDGSLDLAGGRWSV